MIRLVALSAIVGAAFAANAFPTASHETLADTTRHINQSGFVCSEIVSMSQGATETLWNVRCVEFHDGSGRAHFAVDSETGLVMRTF